MHRCKRTGGGGDIEWAGGGGVDYKIHYIKLLKKWHGMDILDSAIGYVVELFVS